MFNTTFYNKSPSNTIPTRQWKYLYLNELDTLNLKRSSPSCTKFQVLNNCTWQVATILDGADYRTFPSPQKVLLDNRDPERWQGWGNPERRYRRGTPSSAYSLCPNLWNICVCSRLQATQLKLKEQSFLTNGGQMLFHLDIEKKMKHTNGKYKRIYFPSIIFVTCEPKGKFITLCYRIYTTDIHNIKLIA